MTSDQVIMGMFCDLFPVFSLYVCFFAQDFAFFLTFVVILYQIELSYFACFPFSKLFLINIKVIDLLALTFSVLDF